MAGPHLPPGLKSTIGVVDVQDVMADQLPPLTGSPELDPWRIRYRLELAGELHPRRAWRREGPTPSESLLWAALESEPVGWTREYTTGPYRLDFYCPLARLAVEVDGGVHLGREAGERDALRDEWHRAKGIATMRVSAHDVERDVDGIVGEVRRRVGQRVRLALGDDEVTPSVLEPGTEDDAPGLAGTAEVPSLGLVAASGRAGTADLARAADEVLGEALTVRDRLQADLDQARALTDVVAAAGSGSAVPAGEGDAGEPDEVAAAVQHTQVAVFQARVGSAATARAAQRGSAAACRTVLPEFRDGLPGQVLRRAGLPVGRRAPVRE